MFDGEHQQHDLIQHAEQAATMSIHQSRAHADQQWLESPAEDEGHEKGIPPAFVEMRERNKAALESERCQTIYEDDSSSGDPMYS